MFNPVKKRQSMKTYIKPSTKVCEVQPMQLMTGSLGYGNGQKDAGNALTGGFRGWTNVWEME